MAGIQLLQGLSLPGSPNRPNDDAMGATRSIAFVLDGVTSLASPPLLPGDSDAAWVSHYARDVLLRHGPDAAKDVRELVRSTATQIEKGFEATRNRTPSSRFELPWTTLCMVALDGNHLRIAFVGDSRVLIETAEDAVHNYGISPSRSAYEARMARKLVAAGRGIGVDAFEHSVVDDLRKARELVNTPEGYWLLGPDPRVADHLQEATLELNGPATVLLVTDGFYALVEDYKRYGDRELIATSQVVGLAALGHELRRIEEEDPAGHKYPRMKKSDDATALLLRIEV